MNSSKKKTPEKSLSKKNIDKIALNVLTLALSQSADELDIVSRHDLPVGASLISEVKMNDPLTPEMLKKTTSSREFSNAFSFYGSVDGVARDLFESYDVSQLIDKSLKTFIDNEDNASFMNVGIDWEEYFDATHAITLFSNEQIFYADDDPINTKWVGHPEKGWMFCASSSVPTWCDENYDLSVDFKFWTGLEKGQMNELIRNKISEDVQAASGLFARSLSRLKRGVPEHLVSSVIDEVMKSIKSDDAFYEIYTDMTKTFLSEGLNDIIETKPSTKKTSKI